MSLALFDISNNLSTAICVPCPVVYKNTEDALYLERGNMSRPPHYDLLRQIQVTQFWYLFYIYLAIQKLKKPIKKQNKTKLNIADEFPTVKGQPLVC